MADAKVEKAPTKSKPVAETVSYYEGIGRRKESSARVRLYVVADTPVTVQGKSVNKGDVVINGRPSEAYFRSTVLQKQFMEPFRTTNTIGRFAVTITTAGGGIAGQMGAAILGVSRALEKVDKEKFRPILKKRGFMSRDSRIKQRRKAGYAGKSRARKQSPKR